jgi:hypothetical protein
MKLVMVGSLPTTTSTVASTRWPWPSATSTYVVVTIGVTGAVPVVSASAMSTMPPRSSRRTRSARWTCHDSSEAAPGPTKAGLAAKRTICGAVDEVAMFTETWRVSSPAAERARSWKVTGPVMGGEATVPSSRAVCPRTPGVISTVSASSTSHEIMTRWPAGTAPTSVEKRVILGNFAAGSTGGRSVPPPSHAASASKSARPVELCWKNDAI